MERPGSSATSVGDDGAGGAAILQFLQQGLMDLGQGRNGAQGGDDGLQSRVEDALAGGETSLDKGAQGGRVEGLGEVLMSGGDEGQLAQGDVAGHDDANGGRGKEANFLEQFAALHEGHELDRTRSGPAAWP